MKQRRLLQRKLLILLGVLTLLFISVSFYTQYSNQPDKIGEASKSDNDHWKKVLTKQQYYVLREGRTDIPFSSPEMLNNKEKGTYVTADCNEPVFRSEQKFDSGTGWPSFTAPINEDAVVLKEDYSLGMRRIEVIGKKCGGHLGHVFDDGPPPTGKRYCINASALKFIPDKKNNI